MSSSIDSRPGTRETTVARPAMGLRELKKARTTEAIQRHAVRLFLADGYDATTVEAVAAAAEVAPSTVYRYFPTKEDLVTADEVDEPFLANFRSQPAELSVVQAMRRSIEEISAGLSADMLAMAWKRNKLLMTEPSLRGANLGSMLQGRRAIAEMVAERIGRPADDPDIGWFTGAVIGIALELNERWVDDPEQDTLGIFADALVRLEPGFPL